jgi:hypothetical protein
MSLVRVLQVFLRKLDVGLLRYGQNFTKGSLFFKLWKSIQTIGIGKDETKLFG